jgi:hypothetical protein
MITVRNEPNYVDQVARRLEYEKTHPDTEIIYIRPPWQAIIREAGDGMTVITRMSLKQLMDTLEALGSEEKAEQK